jgi:hypothetical protein
LLASGTRSGAHRQVPEGGCDEHDAAGRPFRASPFQARPRPLTTPVKNPASEGAADNQQMNRLRDDRREFPSARPTLGMP